MSGKQRDLARKEAAIEEYSRAEEARKQKEASRRLRCVLCHQTLLNTTPKGCSQRIYRPTMSAM